MSEPGALLSAVPFLKSPSHEPYLEGLACRACGKVFLDRRRHCAACGARDALSPQRLAPTGTLHAFTIVQRSFPGVPVPYVSAIVDLDGGGCVKGNLRDVSADPRHIEPGMRVRVAFAEAEQRDAQGQRYLLFYFTPEGKTP
jgi:hypothetical protein